MKYQAKNQIKQKLSFRMLSSLYMYLRPLMSSSHQTGRDIEQISLLNKFVLDFRYRFEFRNDKAFLLLTTFRELYHVTCEYWSQKKPYIWNH